MINFTRKPRYGYEDLLEIIRLLRSPEGCPWDRVQTHQSIRRNFLEETYEALDAIDRRPTRPPRLLTTTTPFFSGRSWGTC